MTHGAWRQRALILQGRPVWLKVVQKPSPSRVAIALTLPAARATSTLLSARRVWKPLFLATPAAAARRALRACASHSVPWTMSALVDPNARQEGQSLLPRILLDAPYVEAQGSADIAARENVAQEREVADEVLVLDLEQEGAVLSRPT